MFDAQLFIVLLLALAVGWWVGRYQKKAALREDETSTIPLHYAEGVRYLIEGVEDDAIETFMQSLPVNEQTFELHLSIGVMMRRRGEVGRAILIHQNLLSRPRIAKLLQEKAQMELAKDYMKAGWLDRAERLLQEFDKSSGELQLIAQRRLLEIYQEESEWPEAITIAEQLIPKGLFTRKQAPRWLQIQLAQYYCELAEIAIKASDTPSTISHAKRAISINKDCVRAVFIQAQLSFDKQDYVQAIKLMNSLPSQSQILLVAKLDLLVDSYMALGDLDLLISKLQYLLDVSPSTEIVLVLSQLILRKESQSDAEEYLRSVLVKHPSLKVLESYLSLAANDVDCTTRDAIAALDEKNNRHKPFLCSHCGFKSQNLHWNCPTCKKWETLRYRH